MANDPAVAVVCVGMAGSGKTTFMQRINSHLHAKREPPYVMNLDPAVLKVPFDTNIDIRDSVNYKEVMKQYNLGPNGGILTSLNLFATKIDQILALLEKRAGPGFGTKSSGKSEEKSSSEDADKSKEAEGEKAGSGAADEQAKRIKHIIVDTPGQIEVFVWSASGDILLGSLASSFPTVIAYIIDTPRTASTSTFMSNMLYACSIMYKTKLPMILVFNKTDVKDAAFAKEWMTDFEAFQAALREEEETGRFGGIEGGGGSGGSGYMGSLLNSMSLMLEEFYNHLDVVGVSAATGYGIDDFFQAVKNKAAEFERDYRPELEQRWKERDAAKERPGQQQDLGRMMEDMRFDEGRAKGSRRPRKPEPETISDIEDEDDEDDEDYDEDGELVDPDSEEEEEEDEEEDDASGQNLSDHYKKAIKREGGHNNPSGEDLSFAKYIHTANVS